MIRSVPLSVWIPVIATASTLPLAGLAVATIAGRAEGVDRSTRLGLGLAIGLASWGALVSGLSLLEIFSGEFSDDRNRFTPALILVIFLMPPIFGPIGLRHMPRLRAGLAHRTGLASLALLHLARPLGLVFLILHAHDLLPGHFAYPAAWGDVVTGVMAPVAAWAVWTHYDLVMQPGSGWRWLFIGFNIAGLVDLAYAVGAAASAFPAITQVLDTDPSTAVFGGLPMVLFPAYMVSFGVMVHVIMLDLVWHPDTGRRPGSAATSA